MKKYLKHFPHFDYLLYLLKVVLKKCIESKSDIKSMADGKSLDMLTDKIMELVRDVYL